ncbi:class I SAM-dependent methyltransferase [Mycolicibacterium moriokaense]|nr:class I SAM-dependent methyltransferase [Mycolicibacterium moriokaense]
MSTRWQNASAPRGDDYDARWRKMAAEGKGIHGEADLIESLLRETGGTHVLDAGCGTGRVAIELASRGFTVVGLDSDAAMLDTARAKAPELQWVHADLVDTAEHVGSVFDVVVAAGNVMIFLTPGTEHAVVGQLAARLAPGGLLVAGFQLQTGRLTLERYDECAEEAGLELVSRWSTWDREPFAAGDYAVSLHRRD